MDDTNSMPSDLQRQQDRKRKGKAILAGGVVLGLGAAVTLAAWSDDVFADGTFNTTGNTFELQGAVDSVGTDFYNYDGPAGATDVAELNFDLESLGINTEEMEPSETVYAPISIATSPASKVGGTFTLGAVTATGNYADVLTYRIATEATHNAACSDGTASFDTPWAGGNDATVDTLVGGTDALAVAAARGTDGPPTTGRQHLCVAVTLGDVPAAGAAGDATRAANQNAVMDATEATPADNLTSVTWEFSGVATS